MVDINTARQQAQEARQNLTQRREEAQKAKAQLEKARQALPSRTSQQALRGRTIGKGLKGRQIRRQIAQSEQKLETKKGEVEQFEQELQKYETEKLKPVESQIKDYDLRKSGLEQAKKLYRDKIPIGFLSGSDFDNPYTYQYLKEMKEQGKLIEEGQAKLSSAIESYNQGKPLDEAFSESQVRFLKAKGYLEGDVPTIEDKKSAAVGFNSSIEVPNIIRDLNDSSARMDRQERIKLSPITGMSVSGIGLVSAQGINKNQTKIELPAEMKPREIYSSQLGGFVQATAAGGTEFQGTAVIRPPTPQELNKINRASDLGKEIVKAPIKFLGGEYEWQKKLMGQTDIQIAEKLATQEERYKDLSGGSSINLLLTGTKGERSAISKGLTYEQAKSQGYILYGQSPTEEQRRQALIEKSGGKYSPLRVFDIAGGATQKASEKISVGVFKQKPLKAEQKKQISNLISDTYKFAAFSPLMSTGAAARSAESKYIYDYKKGKYVLKDKADDILKTFDDAFKKGGRKGVVDKLKKLAKEAESTKGVENLLSELRNKGYIDDFIVDTTTGAFSVSTGAAIAKPTLVEIQLPVIKKIKGIAPTGSSLTGFASASEYTGTGQYERTSEVLSPQLKMQTMSNQRNIFIPQLKTNVSQRANLKLESNIKETQRLNQTSKQKFSFSQPQIQLLKTALKTKQKLKTKQEARQDTRQRSEPKETNLFKPRKPKSKGILQRLAKKAEDGTLFEAIGFRGGKEVSLGFGSKSKASEKLSGFLKGTLGASGFLKETKSGKKLKAKETGLLRDLSFRTGKSNPFLVVEKKQKRLRKGTTGKQIQYFRKTNKSKKSKSIL
ncbi:MAG: hypothetical protein ACLFPS_05830 [Clostridia bacterium]